MIELVRKHFYKTCKNSEVSLGVMLSSWIALEMELKNAPLYDFAYLMERKLNEVYLIEKGVVYGI